jgi:hypothetical protein
VNNPVWDVGYLRGSLPKFRGGPERQPGWTRRGSAARRILPARPAC